MAPGATGAPPEVISNSALLTAISCCGSSSASENGQLPDCCAASACTRSRVRGGLLSSVNFFNCQLRTTPPRLEISTRYRSLSMTMEVFSRRGTQRCGRCRRGRFSGARGGSASRCGSCDRRSRRRRDGRGLGGRFLRRFENERPSGNHDHAQYDRQQRASFRGHFLGVAHERTSSVTCSRENSAAPSEADPVAQTSVCGFSEPLAKSRRRKNLFAGIYPRDPPRPEPGPRRRGVNGWQRAMRRKASHEPRRAPCTRTASAA